MNFDEKDGFNLNDLARRLANIIRLGQIFAINYATAKARVKIGDLQTDWLPWIASNSGSNKDWNPPEIDEQVMILSPCGELNQGVIFPSLYRENAPENSGNIQSITFADGSKISFNRISGNLDLDIKGSANIKVAGNAQIEAANITLKGNVDLGGSGGTAVARVGDKVRITSGSSAGEWPIIGGSSNVKAT
ncbi:MAG: phage baseplate assembly protein V [Proteobacteria bacterium]|nr:phage baseplate assembly protein V [Pseudomonadota bacterium]